MPPAMYAIIRSGGKQTKVREGDVIHVERLRHSGEEVTFTPILVVDESGTAISGRDELSAITVRARVLGEVRGEKVDVFKFKNKTGYRRSQGHRQTYTTLEVTGIELPAKTRKKSARTPPEPQETVGGDEAAEAGEAAPPEAPETAAPEGAGAPADARKKPKTAKVTGDSSSESE
jgi:large subunit ribosomal protein L21